MLKAKTLASLFILVFAVPSIAQAGLNVYPADGPAPKVQVEPPKPLEYQVQKGDTVAVIAKKFSVDPKALLAANGMADPRKLQAGKTLKIPGVAAPVKPASPAPVAPAAVQGATPAQPGTPAKVAAPAPEAKPLPAAKDVAEKPDATARKASKGGESTDPGVVEEKPVKGVKGKKGKQEPAAPPPPPIELDAKTRASLKTGVISNTTDVPQNIRDEFLRYAKKWVDDLEILGVGTIRNKKIKQVGGQWEATYRVIAVDTLGAEVKKVNYEAEDTPYVGHITYVQRVYTCVAPTKQAALQGPFTTKDESIREIFSYSGKKKAWR